MKVNSKALNKLAKDEKWSIPELASRLGVEYSYLYRVLKKGKNGGGKLFNGIYRLCKEKGLDVEDYIFLTNPLSTDKERATAKEVM